MNLITVIGIVGTDPISKGVPNGSNYTEFSVASNTFYKKDKITSWYKCLDWNSHPLLKMLKKGSKVVITGKLALLKPYLGQDGEPKISPSILVSDISFVPFSTEPKKEEPQSELLDDEIPF